MKKIYILLITWLLPVLMLAQSTDAFNYQAVVRDGSGQVIANRAVNFRISLLLDKPGGFPVYTETHLALTNDFGLVNLEIGHGIAITGDFSRIDWSANNYYIEVAVDLDGGNNFQVLGASRLLSVPYALYAKTSGNSFNGNYNDLQNKPEALSAFMNDEGYITMHDLEQYLSGESEGLRSGVPSQVWSLFGNSKSDPTKDKLGTTDSVDLVMVTNDIERLRIKANGDIDMPNSLTIGQDLTVNHSVYLNAMGGSTTNYGPFTVENNSPTYLTGTLDVDGATSLNNSLDVDGAASFHSTMEVDGDADFNSNLNVDGETTLNDILDVDGATSLHSTLEVDGESTFHGAVGFDADVDLSSGLTVGGPTILHSTLDVDGATNISNTFHATGASTLGSTLGVTGATTLNSTLTVSSTATLNGVLNANGQVTIDASVAGGDGAYGAYPLRVQGSDQGIAIKVNGTRSNSKNFLTFWDANGRQGRIEGQTSTELHNSFDYIWFQTQEALQTAFQLAMVIADIAGVDDIDASIIEGVELVDIIANWAVMAVEMDDNVGVAFESGSGDYAEWLQKASQSELFSYGDIVGISGGKISKSMEDPDMYLVVSMSPIVLGNMPPEGNQQKYEKVAFMGQVPVKVRGNVSIGDYILASGMNDGFGVAVHPADMKIDQYRKIVGIAWSPSTGNSGWSYINTAIGLNTNDLTAEISRQQAELESMKTSMNSIMSYLKAKDPGFDASLFEVEEQTAPAERMAATQQNTSSKAESVDRLLTYLQSNPEVLQQIMAEARSLLDQKGIDYTKFEQTNRLVTDQAYYIDVLRSTMQ